MARRVGWAVLASVLTAGIAPAQGVDVDLSGYRADCGVEIARQGDRLTVGWPIEGGERAAMVLDLSPGARLIERLELRSGGEAVVLARDVDPATFVTVGRREAPAGRPPGMSVFNVFFDSPAKRPYQSFMAELRPRRARVTSRGHRATIALGDMTAGPFSGELELTVYAGARLLHVESALRTSADHVAYLYDTGLVGPSPGWRRMGWIDTEGRSQTAEFAPGSADRPVAVRHRALVAEGEGDRGGALACFPPPHQFFSPRDRTDNLQTAWFGKAHRGLAPFSGFGVRQSETGGGSFVPWFNAPPNTVQRMGVFYLLSRGPAGDALRDVLKLTHGDRFPSLPGYLTFTSHWHMAISVAAMQEQAQGQGRTVPDFVGMFKAMGVNLVHLAEFHGDGHPQDPGPLRTEELAAMFAECRRLSDSDLLFLPGEEANVYLGVARTGQHPGHWLYLFPKPVAWIMKRSPEQPFSEPDPRFGTLYRVGDREDLVRLLEQEHGLAWTAHARIKASSWAPDAYRDTDYFRAPFWLGAAWKAMPADLSRDRLGDRVLDLFSDMANWGAHKYVLGEVDVFKLDHTHELYGHMNVNYLKLDRVPRFDEGWQPVLDALRAGRFFVSTGEVLIRDFTVGGQPSGETLALGSEAHPEVRATIEWTFPMRFVELVSGDGHRVYRDRIDLSDTDAFGHRTITLRPDLSGRTWARLEAWDVATDGAFTQPVWLAGKP